MTLIKFANGHTNKVFKPVYTDVFDSFFNSDPFLSKSTVNRTPAVNIAENDQEFQIELAVPGLNKEDFKINLEQNQLRVTTEKKDENAEADETKKFNRQEYCYSSFTKTFNLPETADQHKIQAEYKDGILHINLAKKEDSRIMSREILVK